MQRSSEQFTGGPMHTVWVQEEFLQPWDGDIDEQTRQPSARRCCPECSACHESADRFCGECNKAVGDYNNLMPDLMVFSIGEVARTGVSGVFPATRRVLAGYLVFACLFYLFLAPVYLALLMRHTRQLAKQNAQQQG